MSTDIRIALNLPIPPSVNAIRRVDWANNKARRQFYLHADLFITAHGPRPPPVRMVTGPYELEILVPDTSRLDLDNHVKSIIDYLVSREFIPGDSKKYLRGYSVHWAPIEHCRVTITGVQVHAELVDRGARQRIADAMGQ
jgi:hypothetical protein